MQKQYKELILDDSVLDIDKWLPQSAVDEIVELIIEEEKKEKQ